MKQLIILAFLCIPLLSNSQLPLEVEKPIKEEDTVRIKLQNDISELIRVNEESKKLSNDTNKKLSEIVILVRKKVKNEDKRERVSVD